MYDASRDSKSHFNYVKMKRKLINDFINMYLSSLRLNLCQYYYLLFYYLLYTVYSTLTATLWYRIHMAIQTTQIDGTCRCL